MEVPQQLPVPGVNRGEGAAIVAIENQAPGCADQSAPRAAPADLRNLPRDLTGLDVDRSQELLRWIAESQPRAASIKRLARFPPRVRLRKNRARLPHHHVEQPSGRTISRRHPVGRPRSSRTRLGPLHRWFLSRNKNRPALRVDTARPGDLLRERLPE